jgi:P-type Ca2+ transporter type 2C
LAAAPQVYKQFHKPRGFYSHGKVEDERMSQSVLFNAFIFMQLFNELNSRKILDEYNVLAGIQKSFIFFGVLVVTSVLQVIIMETKVSIIFKVHQLSGVPFRSHAVGLSVLPVAGSFGSAVYTCST